MKAVIYSHVLAYYTYQTYVIRIQLVILVWYFGYDYQIKRWYSTNSYLRIAVSCGIIATFLWLKILFFSFIFRPSE